MKVDMKPAPSQRESDLCQTLDFSLLQLRSHLVFVWLDIESQCSEMLLDRVVDVKILRNLKYSMLPTTAHTGPAWRLLEKC